MFEVTDNFLHKNDFNNLEQVICDPQFPWYYYPAITYEEGKEDLIEKDLTQYQFTHMFYQHNKPNSNYFDTLLPLIDKLGCKALVRIKANLNPYSSQFSESWNHVDLLNHKNLRTAVFYVNTNNGYTKFKKNNKKVSSIKNRVVVFNSNLEHLGTNTTNCKRRIVININYYQ